MTDKQIIIDGVDVSGCKHYKNRTCIADYCLTDMPFGEAKCELNPNCHYKQLKRKEQECERLKRDYFKQNEWLQEQKKELNQLKAENDTYKKMLEDEDVQLALNEVRTGERHLWYNKAQKLSQALTEIKEILLFNKKELEECLYNDIDGQIMQKCEVLDE